MLCVRVFLGSSVISRNGASVKEYPVFRPGSRVFSGKSGFGIVGIGYGMAHGGGKIGYEPGRFRGCEIGISGFLCQHGNRDRSGFRDPPGFWGEILLPQIRDYRLAEFTRARSEAQNRAILLRQTKKSGFRDFGIVGIGARGSRGADLTASRGLRVAPPRAIRRAHRLSLPPGAARGVARPSHHHRAPRSACGTPPHREGAAPLWQLGG